MFQFDDSPFRRVPLNPVSMALIDFFSSSRRKPEPNEFRATY
jgi:hypothetical protein